LIGINNCPFKATFTIVWLNIRAVKLLLLLVPFLCQVRAKIAIYTFDIIVFMPISSLNDYELDVTDLSCTKISLLTLFGK
jgi:hypothetical protein